MTQPTVDIREELVALRRDDALAPFLREGAAVVLWSCDTLSPLAATEAGAPLLGRTAPGGRLDLALPTRERLRRLAGGLAPRSGVRLERLRFVAGSRADTITCVCRLVTLLSGEEALLTAAMGGLPTGLGARAATPSPVSMPMPGPAPAPAADPVAALRDKARRRATVRFLWDMDAAGLFTRVSPELAEVVGEDSADLVGRTWGQAAAQLALDPGGEVERALAREATWSGRVVLWPVAGTRMRLPVELAAIPLHDRERRFTGFRGFGLCRLDDLREEADAPVPDDMTEPAVAPVAAAAAAKPEPAAPPVAEAATNEAGPREELGAPPAPEPEQREPVEDAGAAREAALRAALWPALREAGRINAGVAPFAPVRGAVAATLGAPRVVPLRLVETGRTAAAAARVALPDEAPVEVQEPAADRHGLSSNERNAFREIARALGARLADDLDEPRRPAARQDAPAPARASEPAPAAAAPAEPVAPVPAAAKADAAFSALADRLPIGVLVARGEAPIYANRTLLDLLDYADLAAIAAAGGVPAVFEAGGEGDHGGVCLKSAAGELLPVDARLTSIDWQGEAATLMAFRRAIDPEMQRTLASLELDLKDRDARAAELAEILDTATDGVAVLDEQGRILSLNRSAEALFGYDQNEVAGEPFTILLAPESHAVALDYLEGLKAGGVASVLNDGREVTGRVRQGGKCPLTMTMGRIGEAHQAGAGGRKYCAVVRDMTASKKAEAELVAAKKAAEQASAQKSDFLAKISHEIRTPLNAIIGFAEVMLEERFGPIANERYKEYLNDIHASGGHVISLVNDLLDLAKIEAGRLELNFTSVNLNEVVAGCVALMQPQATRERIVLRSSLAPKLPPIVADERSMRQIVLNVLSNAVKFTDAGGQVIVSTTLTDRGEVALRIRDTGIGMTESEVDAALEPFRQLATARRSSGTGLGLPLTKALVEANRGTLAITSAKREGTLVEIVLPPTRVLAE